MANIIPDPHYRDSGIHQTLRGGYLDIHADYNQYAQYDMHRRVNAFLFLNPNWPENYGGHLELWSPDLKLCNAKVIRIVAVPSHFNCSVVISNILLINLPLYPFILLLLYRYYLRLAAW
ncbi:2OG-Fe(II) oxygenase [archaeon]|nr:MAG: 2OG-Fe(II) oxygenase [archaeon]